jgi:hypothetical protein
MSAGAGGSKSKSKSSSKPTLLPEQKEIWQYFGTDIIPMARGQETTLTRRMEQIAMDESQRQKAQSMQGLMELAGRANLGASDVAGLQKQQNEMVLQQTLQNIQNQRAQMASQALNMISGLPIQPSQSSKSKSSSFSFSAKGGMAT